MWERMTIDEYAGFEAASGTEVVKVDGLWWKRARPFFYQPLFPFQELAPHAKRAPRGAFFGGFQHLVPNEESANSRRNFFIWDDVTHYSIQGENHNRRNRIKKGIRHFSVKEVAQEEFTAGAYPVYCSFYERTKYQYKKERTERKYFAQWARTLYRFPKVKILGAYHGNELSAVNISYLVEDVLFDATFFSKTEYLQYWVADLLIHSMRQMAAVIPSISFICRGVVTGHTGLDASKLMRGCKILSKPALYHLNPLALFVLTTFMKNNYEKLVGIRDLDAYKQKIKKAECRPSNAQLLSSNMLHKQAGRRSCR